MQKHLYKMNQPLSKAPNLPTTHSLRHTFKDRLSAVEYPMDMIDQIGGWRSAGGIGMSYGEGYGLEQIRVWLINCSIMPIYQG